MGASLGGSYGSSSGTTTGTSRGTTNYSYSPAQTTVQTQLGQNLATDQSAAAQGILSPGVRAQKTAAAEDINRTAATGLQGKIENFLAARGFGKSGATGKATLQSELAREGAQGANAANFAQIQQNANSTNLLAALQYAFTQLGLTTQEAGTTTGKQSGFAIAGGVGK